MTKIVLPFPPSTNNLFFTTKYGRARTQRYDSWIMEAGNEILRQRPKKVTGPVTLSFEFQEKDRRPRDISNLIKAPEDLLVKHGIIEKDDNTIVRGISAKWSDEVEGCRITIESIFSSVASVASASPSASHDGQATHERTNHRPQRGTGVA